MTSRSGARSGEVSLKTPRWPPVLEANLDGLVGPTHHYAGLSFGNVASAHNRGKPSNPRKAALQGLRKMRFMLERGVTQLILPPQLRPDLGFLHGLGFRDGVADLLQSAHRADPVFLAAAWSASAMWAANAATFTPACDQDPDSSAREGYAHFTPANLSGTLHRSLEAAHTAKILPLLFPASAGFIHHPALPSSPIFGDEGAANHTRLAPEPGLPGLHVFVHGRSNPHGPGSMASAKAFPARQSLEASQAVARLHALAPSHVLHLRQNPKAIAAGVFHNDVIAVGQGNAWLAHEDAYDEGPESLARVARHYAALYRQPLNMLQVSRRQLPLSEAVGCYLFNSQLFASPEGGMEMLCAEECRQSPRAVRLLRNWMDQGWLKAATFLDLRQSMRNGGGPACLRLRLTLTQAQIAAMPPGLVMTAEKISALENWVSSHYRDRLVPRDLLDANLVEEVFSAHRGLMGLLGLPGTWS